MDHAEPPMPTNEELETAITTLMQVSAHVRGQWVKLALAEAVGKVDSQQVLTKPHAIVICYAPEDAADLVDFLRVVGDFEKDKALAASSWGPANTQPGARPGGLTPDETIDDESADGG